jgi:hypothetical protein
MKSETKDTLLFLALVGFFFCIGCMAGCDTQNTYMERSAVRAGAGEYYIDEHFNKRFRWKEKCE